MFTMSFGIDQKKEMSDNMTSDIFWGYLI